MKYIISQVAFSGNKGAAGMAESLIQNISSADSAAEFGVLSYYVKEDSRLPVPENVRLLNGEPPVVLLHAIVSVWIWLAVWLHLPEFFWRHGFFKDISEYDLWLDAAGISFVDGREKFTIFNILSLMPAFAVRVPVVKVSQAMGPFRHFLNRMMARLYLPKFELIVARGDVSREYVETLRPANLDRHSDVALFLKFTDDDRMAISKYIPGQTGRGLVGISPSQVVFAFCKKSNIPYLDILKGMIVRLTKQGYHCVLFPHSARQGKEATHNNDLPVLDKLATLLGPDAQDCTIVRDELSPGQLRALIERFDILVASRFHAIISAMATATPTVVIGWSHKYGEVLEQFHVPEYAIAYADLSPELLCEKFDKVFANREAVAKEIKRSYDGIIARDRGFFAKAVSLAQTGKR
ncbi:MAG: polysaccharide pyruvyl transferase family protein [Victivallaceae bacterium]|nr:polysaccharide pyruvyl transferase family protein [Victivallaceae bacterium]